MCLGPERYEKVSVGVYRYRYNGKELNEDIGLYAYGFRYYDPAIGRFTGVDPIADQFPHVSTYNYAENSPIANIDLHGLQRYYAADGSLLHRDNQSNQIRVVQNQRVGFFQTFSSREARLQTSSPLSQSQNDAQANVTRSINEREINPANKNYRTMVNWGDDKDAMVGDVTLATTWSSKLIELRTVKEHNGEVLLDDFNNLVNTLFHEDQHRSQGVGNNPFDHFGIIQDQVGHASFEGTTANFKDFMKTIAQVYLNQQQSRINETKDDDKRAELQRQYDQNLSFFNSSF